MVLPKKLDLLVVYIRGEREGMVVTETENSVTVTPDLLSMNHSCQPYREKIENLSHLVIVIFKRGNSGNQYNTNTREFFQNRPGTSKR